MPQLAALIRAKYPGAYDDIPDAELEQQVLAKHPEYADIATPAPSHASSRQPSGDFGRAGAYKQLGSSLINALPTIGGSAAAMIGGVGGTVAGMGVGGVPGAIGGAALGGAAGEAAKQLANRALGNPVPATMGDAAGSIGTQAAIQGGTELAGAGVGKGLELAGRGLYRAAVRPAARLTEKYGDLVKAGLEEAAPVGSSRAVQADMSASKGAARGLVGQAEAAGKLVPTQTVTDKFTPLLDTIERREALGHASEMPELAAREAAFTKAHPGGQMKPLRALDLKQEADTLANTAQNQVRRGVTPTDMTAKINDAQRSGLKEGLESVTPGLEEQNARTSTLYGLSRALRSAENRPHGLTDLASIAGGVAGSVGANDRQTGVEHGLVTAAMLRALASPAVQSRAGILSYGASKMPYAQAARLAMLLALSGTTPTETESSPQSGSTRKP